MSEHGQVDQLAVQRVIQAMKRREREIIVRLTRSGGYEVLVLTPAPLTGAVK